MNASCPTCAQSVLDPQPEASVGRLRSVLVAVAGGFLLSAGVVGLFLPLPGVLLIALGLSVLGTRFQAVRRFQSALQHRFARLRLRTR